MDIIIRPSTIEGILSAPPSKSHSQRALAAALIRKGRTTIHNFGHSNDELAALSIIKSLGAEIEKTAPDSIRINSLFPESPVKQNLINCGESGLSLRMFTPIAAILPFPVTMSGSGSLLKRPIGFFSDVLPHLKVNVKTCDGFIPLTTEGGLKPCSIEVDGSLSSQFISGLLMAYAALNADGVSLKVNHLVSRAYVYLTLSVLRGFGLPCPEDGAEDEFYFSKKAQTHSSDDLSYRIESDWSSAAFLLAAGAINGKVTVTGLDMFSPQPDKRILEPLNACGCALSVRPGSVTVEAAPLKAFHFDATHCPDLFPPLVALAAYCPGISVIEGVHRLIHKESDRAAALQSEFEKLGISIRLEQDKMMVHGGAVHGSIVLSHNDHRIAMATAVAAINSREPVKITGAEAVSKSYPHFFEDLSKAGAELCVLNDQGVRPV
ncbi:MAG TPA: 3-phosphoshikimate 1-carboxyvinyltransferase [Edaphocola sp.]|nr:3-phosphoshikimate 1-carboxyvinyltransferase [Edaphocola sp.]